ncbi:MAG: hypothetical protein KKA52_00050 [Candidatus Omnitrophica bacterium]|nr:hypothetical protein [Candidatus Omnitrophota bacterium]MBU2034274.1 hypothetical protein [Candidatus Omnitrophota bacterium]
MAGKVFISCGQRPPFEKNIAEKVAKLLKEEFELDSYLAFKIQGLNDIMKITEELRSSDYYLFIDFFRKGKFFGWGKIELPCSLFTHQELALAHHLGFQEIISFQYKDAPLEGFLRYVQSNPETFKDENELLKKLKIIVGERGWNKNYSRNLVISDFRRIGPLYYGDQTGQYYEWVWDVHIENRRPDVAAINTACLLDYIVLPSGEKMENDDRSFLKWGGHGGQMGYQRIILPLDHGRINIFAIHCNENGVYLHSALDFVPRVPVISDEGIYRMCYKVFAEHFPLLSFVVELDYKHNAPIVPQRIPINLSRARVGGREA